MWTVIGALDIDFELGLWCGRWVAMQFDLDLVFANVCRHAEECSLLCSIANLRKRGLARPPDNVV